MTPLRRIVPAVLLPLLAACGGAESTTTRPLAPASGEGGTAAGVPLREETVDGVRMWAHTSPGTGGNDAQVAGTVGYDADAQCLYLEADGLRYPVVWPHDAVLVSGEPLEIAAGGASGITVGTYVEGGGGYDYASWFDVDIPADCLGPYDEVATFNQQERITATAPDQ